MKALIDADMLLYECSAVAEYPKDEPIKGFDFVSTVFENKVKDICEAVGAEECLLYITGPGNFREALAVTAPYKGTRKQEKPFHYANLKNYIKAKANCVFVEGMEADDAMAIEQRNDMKRFDLADPRGDSPRHYAKTIICSRDKDLRMVNGWHYGWECGRQPEFRKTWVDDHTSDIILSKDKKTVKGTGIKFFYSQL